MHTDIAKFRDFYDARLGTIARRLIRRRLRTIWPNVKGQTVAGFGYATPYLAPFVDEAERVIACMPAEQGAVAWPRAGRNRVALADDTNLPFPDGAIDRALLVHGLETSDVWRTLLRQIWRVLKPEGRLIIVAPNRRGLWSMFGDTPYGEGHPYSKGELQRLLAASMFTAEVWDSALYGPPVRSRLIMRTGRAWERVGRRLYPGMPGVWIVEVTKAMYAPATGVKAKAARTPPLKPAVAGMPARLSQSARSRTD